MIAAILGAVGQALAGRLIDAGADLFRQYQQGHISREQLQARLHEAMLAAAVEIERSHADTLARTYAAFMHAATGNRLMAAVWAAVTLSQLGVLLWHQLGIPAVMALGWVSRYPSSGSTVEWAYLLVGACVGLGPLVLRAGPGAPTDGRGGFPSAGK